MIIDGCGSQRYRGDVAIKDGIIIEVGPDLDGLFQAKTEIDANCFSVCPGFIDPHVHEELNAVMGDSFESFIRQGVTTLIDGNCGHSVTPGNANAIYTYMTDMGMISSDAAKRYSRERGDWSGVSGFAKQLKRNGGSSVNHAVLLGHGTIRWSIMNGFSNRETSKQELEEMKSIVAQGMEDGAIGLSTGLAYAPGRYAGTTELVELAKVVQKNNGTMASHLRLQNGDIAALKEGIQIARDSGVRFQVSHYSPEYPEGFAMISEANESGCEIGVDIIPKSSGHFKRKDCLVSITIGNSDYLAGKGPLAFRAALHDEKGRKEILQSIRYKDEIRLINTGNTQFEGKLISEIAAMKDVDANDLLLDLIENGPDELTFLQGKIIRDSAPGLPFTGAVRDCSVLSAGSDHIGGDYGDEKRWYELFRNGAFPIFFDCCRNGGLKDEETVRRVTSNVARHFRLTDRGMLKKGYAADIIVVDFYHYTYPDKESINYYNPQQTADGVKTVIVNGRIVFNEGRMTGAKPGKCISTNGRIV